MIEPLTLPRVYQLSVSEDELLLLSICMAHTVQVERGQLASAMLAMATAGRMLRSKPWLVQPLATRIHSMLP